MRAVARIGAGAGDRRSHRWDAVKAASLVVVATIGIAGCGGPAATADRTGRVTVLAAASLTEVFTKLGKDFEAANRGTTVVFSFGASSTLAQQITAGAPADVFASAAPGPMKQVVDAGGADGQPAVFVRNQLVIAVPKGNPQRITGLADLARPGVTVALCATQVPCGAAAKTALAAGGVTVTPVTYEQDVKATLTKVRLGEVDAALVYRTDIVPDLSSMEFPESARAVNDYPIVALSQAANLMVARAFVAFVRSPAALSTLVAARFQAP